MRKYRIIYNFIWSTPYNIWYDIVAIQRLVTKLFRPLFTPFWLVFLFVCHSYCVCRSRRKSATTHFRSLPSSVPNQVKRSTIFCFCLSCMRARLPSTDVGFVSLSSYPLKLLGFFSSSLSAFIHFVRSIAIFESYSFCGFVIRDSHFMGL